MTVTSPNSFRSPASQFVHGDRSLASLLNGEIDLKTQSHTAWGAAVTAQMYLPLERTAAWAQLTDYSRWVQYFPDLTSSHVIQADKSFEDNPATTIRKRLYQAAKKSFYS